MITSIRRACLAVAVLAALAGCSFGSNSVPLTSGNAPSAPTAIHPQNLVAPNYTSVVYSTRVAFRGADGHRYIGDAVVFPEKLFPGLHLTAAMKAALGGLSPHLGNLSYLLEIPGASGTIGVSQGGYKGWNQLIDFSIGYGPVSGKHKPVTELTFQRLTDQVSPYLLQNLFSSTILTGQDPEHGQNVTELDIVKNSNHGVPQRVMYFTFTTVLPVNYATAFGGTKVTETVTLAYKTATFCVIPPTQGGGSGTPVCSTWTPT